MTFCDRFAKVSESLLLYRENSCAKIYSCREQKNWYRLRRTLWK